MFFQVRQQVDLQLLYVFIIFILCVVTSSQFSAADLLLILFILLYYKYNIIYIAFLSSAIILLHSLKHDRAL